MERCDRVEEVEKIEILEFLLKNEEGKEKYAAEVLYANEVYSVNCVTMLPCTPSFIIGIMNFRGKIISVIDMRNFLGFTMKKIDADSVKKVIVMKVNEIEVGIAVDSIVGCREIFVSEIQKNILTITNFNKDYFKGMTKTRSIILDIKNIMMDKKIIINEEIV
ncbi:chemotaxis protein CheW [Crassaminicella profunda]|uniref:chemotaxis protein CheW n=1 Tax=Crassaminicella profunda TaxID=1286698 RepID=UPI001CA7883F|nr:chemotaxis protein CheW [Crassaminicella profunda]QZY57299.1 chemotaxis protein CheW [Crassaminicella profunda]